MRNGGDYTENNCMGCAYHVVLLVLSKCGGKRFGKQLRDGPRICGLNNTTNNIIYPSNAELNPIYHLLELLGAHHILHVSRIRFTMDRKEVDSENEGEMKLCHVRVLVSNGVICLCVLCKDAVNL